MNVRHVKYVLIGGGLASASAAEAIREIDPKGSILLVAQEIVRPYHRPPLSKEFLRRHKSREEVFTHGRDWFEVNQIELRSGCRATQLDVSRSSVVLDRGETVNYEKLLLATGMSANHLDIPGSQLPGIYYLRTLEEAEQLQKAVDKATTEGQPHTAGARTGPRGKAVVIGGGVLGVELAASLTQLGIAVDLLCAANQPWDKFSGELTGKALSNFLTSRGIHVHANARPARLEGDGRVQRVVTGNGQTLECDFAVAAVGAFVSRDLLRGTPIAAEKAILTDTHCRTNVPDVYAAGDCAAIFDPLFGKHRILDHWDNAVVTGTIAGQNMAGRDVPYAAVNQFFSDVFELTLNGWGEARQVDRRIVRTVRGDDGAPPEIIEIGVAGDGRIAQILALAHSGDDDLLRAAVGRRMQVNGVEESLRDPQIALESLLK